MTKLTISFMIISREKLSLSNQLPIIITILYWTYKIAVYIGHFIKNTVIYITNRKLDEDFELEITLACIILYFYNGCKYPLLSFSNTHSFTCTKSVISSKRL